MPDSKRQRVGYGQPSRARTCVLGNGTIAETAEKTKEHITGYGIKEWAPMVPGGKDINWIETEKTMDWMTQYALVLAVRKEEAHLTVVLDPVQRKKASNCVISAVS